ncbi:RNA-binding cell elongation regulator Jag/EloR [Lacticaseibacillus mingshuiensis]|uniref:RNA-binding protein KhpB n=1 Tax=Lacticaseibacillus mingshuiensis TaxID=2799574 RepID=A0ABW4CK24_9LACO|nr:RNA-binding cell elongation regulator Jag/EloR [Lacticaseibacillus mingshuiensis]
MPTFQGATIQQAIETGLASLKVTRQQVNVDVIQEGKKGLFGLGKKEAIVNLKLIETAPVEDDSKPAHSPLGKLREKASEHLTERRIEKQQDKAPRRDDQTAIALVQSYLEDIIRALDIDASITSNRQHDQVWYQIKTPKEALLIGKHGKIINAIQYLAQTEFNHYGKSKWTVMLNVGDYRERRDTAVRRLAEKSAREVIATGTAVYLDPMPSFERKAIHATLADNTYVETHSEGTDPRRYVVVTRKNARPF